MNKTNSFFLIIGVILLQSCVTIKESSLRRPDQEGIELANCKISSTGAIYMNILGIMKTNFIPASIKIELGDQLIYSDPLTIDDSVKADFIFITHNHLDHFSISDIKKLTKSKTIIIGPKTIAKKLSNENIKIVSIGDSLDFGRIKYKVVESYNLHSKMHKKGNNNVGYIITCDSIRIYIAGDTDFIPEMKQLKNITVAIVPIGEGNTAMNPQTAAEAINTIRPKIVIPIHYKLGEDREKKFIELLDKQIEVKLFQKN